MLYINLPKAESSDLLLHDVRGRDDRGRFGRGDREVTTGAGNGKVILYLGTLQGKKISEGYWQYGNLRNEPEALRRDVIENLDWFSTEVDRTVHWSQYLTWIHKLIWIHK